ncbi:MAG TPA: PAS domain S-box protein, partial [Burkholderiales bacterium]|nr:PAS domain S-box protein [Burkholderiales bacterium]
MPRAKQLQRARGEDEAVTTLDAAFKLVDALPVPVFFKSRDGRYLGVNRAWEEFFGIPGESFIGRQVADLYPKDPAIAERHAAMDRDLYARPGRQSYEIAVRARDGKLRDTLCYQATYQDARGEVAGLIGTIVDITERQNVEAALRDNEERYRRTFELAGSGLAQVGLDGRFMRVNRRLCEMFGYSEAELVGMPVKDISHPEDRDAVDERRLKLIAGELDTVRLEKRYLRKDGTTIWANIAIALERDSAGRPLYAISVLDDITVRKQTEERLRESEARYRSTFELAGSGIAHIGLDRKFIRVNRRLCEILGYPEHELIGLTGRDISHPEDLEVINTQRKRLYAGEIDHVHVEKRYLRKDGSTVWVAFSMVLERDAEGQPAYEIAIFDDITERKRAESALRESEERFRSLTQLSSDWYWEQDDNFALRFMSRRMGERTGLDAAAFIGRKRWDQPALNL